MCPFTRQSRLLESVERGAWREEATIMISAYAGKALFEVYM
jgi:hypothetical protein